MKSILFFLSILFYNLITAQTTLTVGDIAIIGFKTNTSTQGGNDAIKLVTFVDLTCGTQFIVTDNNWNASTSTWYCNDDEFAVELTITSKICAGSIIYIDVEAAGNSVSTSSGALTKTTLTAGALDWGSNFGLNSGGDNVFVLQGTRSAPNFIFGIRHNGTFTSAGDCSSGGTPRNNTGKPSALTLGTTAIEMTSSQNQWHYNCSGTLSGTKAVLLAQIGDKTKWTSAGSQTWGTGSCVFSVTTSCGTNTPTHKSVTFGSSSVTSSSATISWVNCGNTKNLVIARKDNPVTTDPTSGTSYTSNANLGSGSSIGSGFVVYDGMAGSVNLTGLTSGSTYYFSIYEYSCQNNCYNVDDLPGSINTPAPLPIELLDFNVKNKENLLEFNWKTANETNYDHFEIEGSLDLYSFEKIAEIKSRNKIEQVDYKISLLNEQENIYFRLKQIDKDGNFCYSSVIEIGKNEQNQISIFPNPTSEILNINFLKNEFSELEISDLTGKIIESLNIEIGSKSKILNVSHYQQGVYVLTFKNINSIHKIKFIKI